jgi:acyl-CoA thioester hydrolase
MYTHEFEYRIPYPEVDRLNVVHHGHYAKYYEIGRLEAMRTLGWSYKQMEDDGIGLFVAEIRSKFLRPARYDDIIKIRTSIPELPGRRILFETEIIDPNGDICNIGTTKLLFVERSRMKVCSMPGKLKALLEPYFKQA